MAAVRDESPAEAMKWIRHAEATWRPRNPEPITLRCWLRAPVAWDSYDGLTIEGALQAVVVMLETGETPDDIFAGYRGNAIDIPTPIADIELGGITIACASWGRPGMVAHHSVRVRRQRPRAELYERSAVRINGGPTKQNQIPTPTVVAPYIDFSLLADRELLLALLPDVTAIARHRSAGLGAILGHELIPHDTDRSIVLDDGSPARTLPDIPSVREMLRPGSFLDRIATTRAPYWLREHRRPCLVPLA
jgi:hypothetical protein